MLPLERLTATGSAPADLPCCFAVVCKQWKNGLCSSLWPVSTWPLDQMFSYLLRVHSLSHLINLGCWFISTTRNHPKKKKRKKKKKTLTKMNSSFVLHLPLATTLFLCSSLKQNSSLGMYLSPLAVLSGEQSIWNCVSLH